MTDETALIDDTQTERMMADFTPEDAVRMIGITDESFLSDDEGNPFADLEPQWQRLAAHLMSHFDPSSLPLLMRPFAPVAIKLMTVQLAQDPQGSRAMALELIDMTVRDLAIEFGELDCWDTAGELHKGEEVRVTVGAPLPPRD